MQRISTDSDLRKAVLSASIPLCGRKRSASACQIIDGRGDTVEASSDDDGMSSGPRILMEDSDSTDPFSKKFRVVADEDITGEESEDIQMLSNVRKPRKKSQRLKRAKTVAENPTLQREQASEFEVHHVNKKVHEFVSKLNHYSQFVMHNEAEPYGALSANDNSESGSESTDVVLEEAETEETENDEVKLQSEIEKMFGSAVTQDERLAMIETVQQKQDQLEDEILAANQHFLRQNSDVCMMQLQLSQIRFLNELHDQQKLKQKDLFVQRVEMRKEIRQEELAFYHTFGQNVRRRENLELMKKKNFGLGQMRTIIEFKRNSFQVWLKNLEARQAAEKDQLECEQRRKKHSRGVMFGVRLKNAKQDEKRVLQKEFKILEQHHKMFEVKQLQHLEQYQKLHRNFVVRKFDQDIHLFEIEQMMSLDQDQKVRELLINQAESVLEAITDIESMKCDIEDLHGKISRLRMAKILRMRQNGTRSNLADFHQSQLQHPDVFDVDLKLRDGTGLAYEETGSVLNSFWSSTLSPCDDSSFLAIETLTRQASRLGCRSSNQERRSSESVERPPSESDSNSDVGSLLDGSSDALIQSTRSIDRKISREVKNLQALEMELKNAIDSISSLRFQHLSSVQELRQRQQKEKGKFYSEKLEKSLELLHSKDEEFKEMVKVQSREKVSLLAFQAKELENFRALVGKELDLQRTGQQMKAVMEAILDPMVVSDEYGRMIVVNQPLCKLFGYENDELLGVNISILMDPKVAARHDGYMKRYQQTRIPHIIGTSGRDALGKKKNGELVPLHLSVSENTVDEKRIFIGCLHDLTELMRREVMLQKARDEAIQASTSTSHLIEQLKAEIRTPLQLLIQKAALLEEESNQEELVVGVKECSQVLSTKLTAVFFCLCILVANLFPSDTERWSTKKWYTAARQQHIDVNRVY
jgi:PAS domain S-box-containing protein